MVRVSLYLPRPQPKQIEFLNAKARHVAYGGGRGGGKSWAVRVKAVLLCLRWKGIKCLIVRKTLPELRNNHIKPLRKLLPARYVKYNKQEREFTFPNGSTITFGYCDNDADLDQYQGAEYDVIFLDEATHLQQEWIEKINLAVRSPNGMPKRTYYTCNPGGPSHNYIKRLFVTRQYEDEEIPEDYMFIQSLLHDNIALMKAQPEYERELKKLPPKLRKAWLEGSWDIFEGQFFEDFMDSPAHYADRTYTHVIDPFEIPSGWKIYRSFDWGYNKPFSCGWWAVDYDGVLYRILELYGCTGQPNEGVKWTPPQVFSEIARIEREHRWLAGKQVIGIADPAIWDAETGESIADTAARHGVFFSKGDNKRIPGWMQVHYRLAFDENGYPQMYIFSNCKHFIRCMPLLQYDEHKVEDLDTEGEDHIADETRYMCMARPIKPAKALPPDKYAQSPMAMFLDIPKDQVRAAPARPRIQIVPNSGE